LQGEGSPGGQQCLKMGSGKSAAFLWGGFAGKELDGMAFLFQAAQGGGDSYEVRACQDYAVWCGAAQVLAQVVFGEGPTLLWLCAGVLAGAASKDV